ncbi:MAG: histidine phosphatase family protein [Nocardioidaceae bacterium]
MPLTVVRHAPTAANYAGVFQGQTDVPPLPLGEVTPIPAMPADVLVSSPLQRAVVAARALFPTREPRLDPRLMERAVGAWEGLDRAAVLASWPDSLVDGRINPDVTPPGGESIGEFLARVHGFLDEQAEETRHVYAVTHNGWIQAALLLTGVISLGQLFADPVPFLTPLPLDLRTLYHPDQVWTPGKPIE